MYIKLTTIRFLSEAHTQQMVSLVSANAWLKSTVSEFVLDGTSSMWNNLWNIKYNSQCSLAILNSGASNVNCQYLVKYFFKMIWAETMSWDHQTNNKGRVSFMFGLRKRITILSWANESLTPWLSKGTQLPSALPTNFTEKNYLLVSKTTVYLLLHTSFPLAWDLKVSKLFRVLKLPCVECFPGRHHHMCLCHS